MLRCENWYTGVAHFKIFNSGGFTNFDILEEFLGLVPIQSTTIGKDILKAKVQCTNIKYLKVQIFASILSIKLS